MSRISRYLPLALIFVTTFAARPAFAQVTEYWNPSGASTGPTDATGTWNTTSAEWYNPSSGSNPVVWDNNSADTAVFGSSSSTVGGNISISGTVNVGAIVLDDNNGYSFNSGGGTIVGNSGTLIIANDSTAYTGGYFFNGITFNASTFDFQSTQGWGIKIINSTLNGNNPTTFNLGTGTDSGDVQVAGGGFGLANITAVVNNGWTFLGYDGNDLGSATITGFGNETDYNGSYGGALALVSSTSSAKINTVPTITLNGDALIANNNAPAGTSVLKGSIVGTGNLFLAGGEFYNYTSSGTQSLSTISSLIISTTNASYSGATIITENTMARSSPTEPSLGLGYQTVALGANNALSTNSELVLGVQNGVAPVTGASAPAYSGNGVFDMAGYNQTFTGITTSSTQASANYIGNNSGAGTSTLTISGTSTPSGGFGGIIRDNLGTTGGTMAVALTSGTLKLSGSNTYSGGTTVSGGTLTAGVAGNGSAGAFGTGALAISGGAVNLNNFAQTVGALTLSGNGALSFGTNTTTTLTASSMSWTGGSGSLLTFNLASGSAASNLLSLSGLLTLSGSGFDIALSGGSAGQTYDLINFNSGSSVSAGQFTESSGLAGAFAIQGGDELVFNAGAVPEPSTWAMLIMGLGFLGWVGRRRIRA